jgi:small subunit ribosomal protein S14
MAKTSSIERNRKRERMTKRFANKRKALKTIIQNRALPVEDRFAATIKLAELPRNSSRTRIHNRCALTGRPRAYYRKFKLCRIKLRDLAAGGKIPGCVKASW